MPSVSMKSAFGMAHPAPVNGGDLALGPDHVTLPHLAVLLIALAYCSGCGVAHLAAQACPVTGGSVSVELLRRQLDLVTGMARFLRSICAGAHRSPVPLESLRDRQQIW